MSDINKLDVIVGRFISATDEARNTFIDELRERNELQKDKTQIAEVAARLEAELYAVLSERNVQAAEIERHMREKVELAVLVMKERDDNERLLAFIRGCSTCKEEWEKIEARLEPKP